MVSSSTIEYKIFNKKAVEKNRVYWPSWSVTTSCTNNSYIYRTIKIRWSKLVLLLLDHWKKKTMLIVENGEKWKMPTLLSWSLGWQCFGSQNRSRPVLTTSVDVGNSRGLRYILTFFFQILCLRILSWVPINYKDWNLWAGNIESVFLWMCNSL